MKKELTNVLAGFAETDITPTIPDSCQLIGFYRTDNTAKGVLDKLKSQILIIKSEMQNYCLLTIDSIGFTIELTNHLRDDIAKMLNVKRENIMVCFSHTHAAPDAAANGGIYFEFVYQKILRLVEEAYANLAPVKVAWGIAENTVGVNRRAGAKIMDNRIGILKIADAISNKTKVVLLRVAVHANVLTSDNFLISADYFGTTRELLEKKYSCRVMVTQGAAGNIKPKYRQQNADFLEVNPLEVAKLKIDEVMAQKIWNESIDSLEKMAMEIYRSVDKVFDKLVTIPIYRITMFSDIQNFYSNVPTMEQAEEIATEAKLEAAIDGTEWIEEIKRLHFNQINCQKSAKEIQYFCVNDGCLCGVPDEPMCEIALDIRKKAGNDFIFFGGYTNGAEGYLPNAKEYDEGGYEVLWSNLIYFKYFNKVMPLNRDTASKLADTVAETWTSILSQ